MNEDSERNIEHYVSTSGLMDVLEISRSTVYRLIARGMPNIMVGSVHRFPIDQVLIWLEENYPTQEYNDLPGVSLSPISWPTGSDRRAALCS